MKNRYLLLTSFIATTLLLGCTKELDLGVRPLGVEEEANVVAAECKLNSVSSTPATLKFDVSYDKDEVTNIPGFQSFDKFTYKNGQIVKATSSVSSSNEVSFEYNNDKQLISFRFKGRDGAGRPYDDISNITYGTDGKIKEYTFRFSVFPDPVKTKFSYNADGNISQIDREDNGSFVPLLINKSFDEKKSPFLDSDLGPVLSYYMIYHLLVGTDNFSQFLNKNNVTSATIYSDKGMIDWNASYDYNSNDFPTSVSISKNIEGRIASSSAVYTYQCK